MAEEVIPDNETNNTVPNNQLVTRINKESTTLIWFDPNIGIKKDTENTKQQLRRINDYVIFYTDLDECIKFIQSIFDEKIFLITSGSKASKILPYVCCLRQVDSIFIFCFEKAKYEYLCDDYSKIIGIYVVLDDLCQSIQQQVELVDKQLHTFSFYDQHQKSTRDLSKQAAEFLWFQLFNYVIGHLPRNQRAKQEMIQMCRQYYRGNPKQIRLIDQFEKTYQPEEAVRWYSKESFVYQLINKALRTEDIDQLYIFRFYIGDLSQSLEREHEKLLLSKEESFTVYRGMKLDIQEFDRLKEKQGKLISTNGYLSTSRSRSAALYFARKRAKRTDVISVLFQIECDPQQLGRSVIFADITKLSEHRAEKEVLFDLSACFRIEFIEEEESLQVIKMTVSNEGQTITKDYLELVQKETEEKSVSIVFGRLMCSFGEYDKSQKYFEQLLHDPNGEDLAWIEHNIGRALYYKGEWEKSRKYYVRAFDRMRTAKPIRIKDSAYVLNNIGLILSKQGKYDEALEFHQRALKVRKSCYPSIPSDIARSLNNIGSILSKQRKYTEALDVYQQALTIKNECYPPGHVSIAASLNNIGIILKEQKKYNEALDYCQKALKMQQNYYPSDHADLGQSLNNIGLILFDQEKYDEALDYYQRALKIREKHYAFDHVDSAQSLYSIGLILSYQKKYDEALEHFQKALKIQEKYYSSGHADTARSLNNIGIILYNREQYDDALNHHQRALKMREEYCPSGHADTAESLYNIGNIMKKKNDCDKALDYYQQALNIQEKYYTSGHADTAKTLNNIGTIFSITKKHEEALIYYKRALEIQEKYYHLDHADIGVSLNNIGSCYKDQNMPNRALGYYRQALTINMRHLSVGDRERERSERNIRRLTEDK
jgi:tetratricopeptide (TPR) repeat protein